MTSKQLGKDGDSLFSGAVGKADQAAVRLSVGVHEESEIRVDRYKDPVVVRRSLQNCRVSGIIPPATGVVDIVATITEPLRELRPRSGPPESASASQP